jgi:hypothetical protein
MEICYDYRLFLVFKFIIELKKFFNINQLIFSKEEEMDALKIFRNDDGSVVGFMPVGYALYYMEGKEPENLRTYSNQWNSLEAVDGDRQDYDDMSDEELEHFFAIDDEDEDLDDLAPGISCPTNGDLPIWLVKMLDVDVRINGQPLAITPEQYQDMEDEDWLTKLWLDYGVDLGYEHEFGFDLDTETDILPKFSGLPARHYKRRPLNEDRKFWRRDDRWVKSAHHSRTNTQKGPRVSRERPNWVKQYDNWIQLESGLQ